MGFGVFRLNWRIWSRPDLPDTASFDSSLQNMKAKNIQFLLLLTLLFFLAGCGRGLQNGEVRGKVLEVNSEDATLKISLTKRSGGDGEERLFSISDGDTMWLKPGREIRGVEIQKDEKRFLDQIFPASNREESHAYMCNQELRNDTVERGSNPVREVGEELPNFALIDQDGNLIDRNSLIGNTTVINFIFTRCTVAEMCPATTMRTGALLQQIKKESFPSVRLISMTMDPEYDTPGVLKAYAASYGVDDPQYRFATGSLQAIRDLKKQLWIKAQPDPNLILQHTMRTLLVGPDLKILYQVPGSKWEMEDFLGKIRRSVQDSSPPKEETEDK